MKLQVTKSALLNGLQTVHNIVGTRSTLPILYNVLINASKKEVYLTTTDLDISIKCQIEATVTKTGSTTLPVRRLAGIVRELPETSIELETDDKHVTTLVCDSSHYKIIGITDEEFPPSAKPEGKYSYRLDQGVFKEMMRKVSYAVSVDETRYVLNGVYMSFKGGKLIMVATDGRRLALVEHEMDFPKEAEIDMILPAKTVAELLRSVGDEGELHIHIKENNAMFEFRNIMVTSKLIEGTYPNYKQVIPSQCEERVTVERETLLTVLRRVSVFTTDKAKAAKITFTKNKLTVTTNTPDVGEATETIPIKYSGKEISVAFNPEFMMDPLKNLVTDEIFIELTDDMSPGVIKCDIPFLYVLMPIRIT